MGVAESPPDASRPVDFADAARSALFPLDEPIPLPAAFADASDFVSSNSDGAISTFRELHLSRLERLGTQFDSETDWRRSFCQEFLRPETGRLHVALCPHAGGFLGINASEWLILLSAGFPLTGTLPLQRASPREKAPSNPPGPEESVLFNKAKRFAYRAHRAPVRSASALWEEAMEQADAGRLTPHRYSRRRGTSPALRNTIAISLFDLAYPMMTNSGCDEMEDSLTNTACQILTPRNALRAGSYFGILFSLTLQIAPMGFRQGRP